MMKPCSYSLTRARIRSYAVRPFAHIIGPNPISGRLLVAVTTTTEQYHRLDGVDERGVVMLEVDTQTDRNQRMSWLGSPTVMFLWKA
jgi:hypothetical protein